MRQKKAGCEGEPTCWGCKRLSLPPCRRAAWPHKCTQLQGRKPARTHHSRLPQVYASEELVTVNVDDVVGKCRVVPEGYPTGEAERWLAGLLLLSHALP